MIKPKKFELKFKQVKTLSKRVHHFIFELLQQEPLVFKAGQFISLHLEKDGQEYRRNYSLANPPLFDSDPNDKTIEFACSYLPHGLASTILWNINNYQLLTASGPYGLLTLPDQPSPRYILIATGTGVTPYRSMLPDLIKLMELYNSEIILLQGVRTRDELLYKDEFISIMQQYKNFNFIACYSRENSDNLLEFERIGYVQDHLNNLNLTAKDMAYLCGHPDMVDAAFERLQNLGLDRKNIKREKYVNAKHS